MPERPERQIETQGAQRDAENYAREAFPETLCDSLRPLRFYQLPW